MNKTLEKILEDELFENETFEGEGNVQIKNTSEGTKMPIQILGNGYQETRNGKNKLNLDAKTVASSGVSSIDFKSNVLTVVSTVGKTFHYLLYDVGTVLEFDGKKVSISSKEINETVSGYSRIGLCKYRSSNPGGGVNETKVITNSNKTNSMLVDKSTNTEYDRLGVIIYINLNIGEEINELTIDELQVEVGEVSDYEAFGSMPSPEYPSEIRNCGDNGNINLGIVNKNLVNFPESKSITSHGITVTYDKEKDEFSYSGTADMASQIVIVMNFDEIKWDLSKEYMAQISSPQDINLLIGKTNVGNNSYILKNQSKVKIENLDKYLADGLGFLIPATEVEQKFNGSFKFWIYEKTSNEEYVLHQEQKISIPTQKEMLEEDYFDLKNKTENHTWLKFVLDGNDDENWKIENDLYFICEASFKEWTKEIINPTDNLSKSTVGSVKYNVIDNGGFGLAFAYGIRIRLQNIDPVNGGTVEQLKTYLAENPITTYVKRKEEEALPMTEEQSKKLDKLQQITAYDDVTNIICEDEIPCNFKIDAKISKIKKLIEKENANV